MARPRVRPRTFDTYEAAVTRHILPTLGPKPLAKRTPRDCQAWISGLAADGVSVGRIRYARVVLRNALNNVSKQFKALLKTAELAPLRIHDLRHSCATLLLAQGVNARTIVETLGHSQISLTLNT